MSLDAVCEVLRYRGRSDLASLLSRASISFDESDTYGSYYCSRLTAAEVSAPIDDYDRLRDLPEKDNGAILSAMLEIWPPKAHDIEITQIVYRLDPSSLGAARDSNAHLLKEIDTVRGLMIQGATGGPPIDSLNDDYRARYQSLAQALRDRGVDNPNPYSDLWDWYGKWSSGDLPSYQSRRQYIRDLYAPLQAQLRNPRGGRGVEVFPEPTGWPRVDRGIGEARKRLELASTEEQFQTVGLLCRETLISLAQTVYDSSKHAPSDGIIPSSTDAKRMLDAYLALELSGNQNEEARKHAKASLSLANALQHERTATFREAALCAEATASVANIIAIVSGRRDPGN